MGEFLRNARLKQGMLQEELAGEFMSTGTISNIERGHRKVGEDKLRYICEVLSLSFDELIALGEEESYSLDEMQQLHLLFIESDLYFRPEEAKNRIQAFENNPWVSFFKGRHYVIKRNFTKAESHLKHAVSLTREKKELKEENLLSFIYYEMSRIYYYRNQMDLALEYIEKGIKFFFPGGKREYIYYYLLTGRIIYLKKKGKIIEAYKRLEDMKELRENIELTSLILTIITLEAELLNDLGYYTESIEKSMQGLDLARIERRIERAFELYCTLGTSYLRLKSWNQAKACFHEALLYKEEVRQDLVLLPLKKLGELYLEMAETTKAIKTYEEARALSYQVEDLFSYCEINIDLGNIYKELDQQHKALQYFEEAMEIAEKYQFHELQVTSSLKYLSCEKQRNTKKFQKVIDNIANHL